MVPRKGRHQQPASHSVQHRGQHQPPHQPPASSWAARQAVPRKGRHQQPASHSVRAWVRRPALHVQAVSRAHQHSGSALSQQAQQQGPVQPQACSVHQVQQPRVHLVQAVAVSRAHQHSGSALSRPLQRARAYSVPTMSHAPAMLRAPTMLHVPTKLHAPTDLHVPRCCRDSEYHTVGESVRQLVRYASSSSL